MSAFLSILLLLTLVATITVWGLRTLRAARRNADTIVGLFAGLSFLIEKKGPPLDLANYFRELHVKLSASVAFALSPLTLSIATLGIVAMMPAMGQGPEGGAVWQLAVALLIALQFLFLLLLHTGFCAAVSALTFAPSLLSGISSSSSTVPNAIQDVIPRPPRILA